MVPAWYKSGEFREVEALARWVEGREGGLITGLPGTMKTTRVLFLPLLLNRVVVVSFPLRQLRDEVYMKVLWDGKFARLRNIVRVVYAHDEVCRPLMRRLERDSLKPYVYHLAEHVEAAAKGVERCLWKDYIENVIDMLRSDDPLLVLTTHRIGFMLKLLSWRFKTAALFVFDEGEDLLLKLGEPIDLDELRYLRRMSKKVYNRMKGLYQVFVKGEKLGYILLPLVRDLFRDSFFVSATFPPKLIEVLSEDLGEPYPVYRMRRKRVTDVFVVLDKELWWRSEGEWGNEIYPQVVKVVEGCRNAGKPVGIVSRNLSQTKKLVEVLEGKGFSVWADSREDNPVKFYSADVVIVTTLGRGYRGVNLYSRRNADAGRWDFPVVIAFFQAKGLRVEDVHPLFYGLLKFNPFKDDGGEMSEFIEQLTYAKNFQSVYRFVRQVNKQHLIVLLDKRWDKVLETYGGEYYVRSQKVRIEDEARLAERVLSLVQSLA